MAVRTPRRRLPIRDVDEIGSLARATRAQEQVVPQRHGSFTVGSHIKVTAADSSPDGGCPDPPSLTSRLPSRPAPRPARADPGTRNEHSIPWGCALALRERRASVVLTWMKEEVRHAVHPLADSTGATLLSCTVEQPGELSQTVADAVHQQAGIDFAAHPFAWAPLQRFVTRPGWAMRGLPGGAGCQRHDRPDPARRRRSARRALNPFARLIGTPR
jgi:hypothetical protein